VQRLRAPSKWVVDRANRVRLLQDESQNGVAQTLAEKASLMRQSLPSWSRRPTIPEMPYCGAAEFDGRYGCVEVMNLDQQCDLFTLKVSLPQPHSCRTCTHNHRTSARIFQILDMTVSLGDSGRGLRDRFIQPWFDAQAEAEYQDCVDFTGVLSRGPVFLPVCAARSGPNPETGEPRFIVGPVVNVGGRCSEWSPAEESGTAPVDPYLEDLFARYQQIDARQKAEVDINASLALYPQVAGSAAQVIEWCLALLGADDDQISSVCTSYVRDVWNQPNAWTGRTPRSGPTASSPEAPVVVQIPPAEAGAPILAGGENPPGSHPEAAIRLPFDLAPGQVYVHPVYQELILTLVVNPGQVTAVVQFGAGSETYQPPRMGFDVPSLVPNTWTQLQSADGPLPIALAPQLPTSVAAVWL
jgi:hypothetical protein